MGDSIQELTSGIKALGESGGLQLSDEEIRNCVGHIHDLRTRLLAEKGKIPALKNFHGSAGYQSGEQTKITLVDDTEAIEKLLDDYLAYLDDFEKTVSGTIGGIVANG